MLLYSKIARLQKLFFMQTNLCALSTQELSLMFRHLAQKGGRLAHAASYVGRVTQCL